MIAHALTSAATLAFLVRHPIIAARVEEFTYVVNTVGYDQSPQPPGGWDIWDVDLVDYYLAQLPRWIPTWRLAGGDTVLPYVVIFPDAGGTLHYTGTDALQALTINDPPPHGIPDASPLDWLTRFAFIGGVLYLVLLFKKNR